MASKQTQKLFDRLRSECGLEIPDGVEIRRTYAGHHQKSTGAWSWFIYPIHDDIGSAHPISELVKAKKITVLRKRGIGTELLIENGDY